MDSRCLSSEETWVKKISKDSKYVILSKTSNRSSVVGVNSASDDYNSLPEKWTIFFRNYDFWDFEWLFCIDDDGFVFPERLEKFIEENNLNYYNPIALGARICESQIMKDVIICGGGGILVSKKAISMMIEHVKDSNYKSPYLCHDCFFHDLFKKLNIEIRNINRLETCTGPFVPFSVTHGCVTESHLEDSITYHYCNEDDKFFLYKKFYE